MEARIVVNIKQDKSYDGQAQMFYFFYNQFAYVRDPGEILK